MRPVLPRTLFLLLICAAPVLPAMAGDLLPADRPVSEAIDHYIDQELKAEKVPAAPVADDANLVRRLMLDLAGRIPTVGEAQAYVQSQEPDKLVKLVDRLMGSPGFVRHQANEFESMLMLEVGGGLRNYLLLAFQEDRPWDRIFRDLVTGKEVKDGSAAENEAAQFLKKRVKDVDALTNDVSVLFFGINVSCAKCHDHPLVDDWTQDHFYGMKSFFNRTFENGGFLAEREYGIVEYKTTEGESRNAKLMFLTGTLLNEPEAKQPTDEEKKKEKQLLEEYKKKKEAPPAPEFSRRMKLIDVALRDGESDFFARAIVNRLFHRLFGQGLVMPLDQMHSGNPPSHPELLDWLAQDLRGHDYDLRRLIRGIVLSRSYARSSRWEEEERPAAYLFAVGRPRPLMPQQLAASLRVASTAPSQFPADMKPEDFAKRIEGLENSARGMAGWFETPTENFQVSVTEALLFSNAGQVANDLLGEGGDRLVGQLKTIEDPNSLVETAFWAVLSRAPREEEMQTLGDYLAARADRRVEACRQIVWALMTSSEFRFNF